MEFPVRPDQGVSFDGRFNDSSAAGVVGAQGIYECGHYPGEIKVAGGEFPDDLRDGLASPLQQVFLTRARHEIGRGDVADEAFQSGAGREREALLLGGRERGAMQKTSAVRVASAVQSMVKRGRTFMKGAKMAPGWIPHGSDRGANPRSKPPEESSGNGSPFEELNSIPNCADSRSRHKNRW